MRARGRERGFTLIEIAVVIVIIGVLAAVAGLSIGNRVNDDKLGNEAERAKAVIALASEEAEAKGVEIGLRFTTGGYRLLVMSSNRRWMDYENAGPLRRRLFTIPVGLKLSVDGRPVALPLERKPEEEEQDAVAESARVRSSEEDAARRITPQVLLLSSGEMTPFTLDIEAPGLAGYRLQGDALGRLTLSRPTAARG